MAEPNRAELLLEAERRGIKIPDDDRALVQEAIQRGIISSAFGTQPYGAAETFTRTAESVTGQSLLPLLLSTVGAVAGARVPGAGPAARVGASAVGAGVGAAVGEVANVPAFRTFGVELQRPTFFDLARTAGLTALLDLAGQGVVGAARRMLPSPAVRPGAQKTVDAMRTIGVEPKVTDISGSRTAAMTERAVQQTVGGGEIISETVERQAGQIRRAADDFLARISPQEASSAVAVGTKASEAVTRQAARVKEVEDYLWQEVRGMATDLPVNLAPLRRTATDIKHQIEQRGELSETLVNSKLAKLMDDILEYGYTAGGKKIKSDVAPWQKVDEWRRAFGESVADRELFGGGGAGSRLYAATLEAMERAAAGTDIPGLGQVYRQVRQFGAQARALFRDSQVAKVLDADPEKVVGILTAGGPTAIVRAREAVMGSGRMGLVAPDPAARETWDLLRRHILEGVFEKARDKSARGFLTEPISGVRLENVLERLGDDTLKELLTPIERKALENIVTVAKAVRLGERAGASGFTSGTAGAVGVQALLALPGAAAGGAVAGGAGAAVGGVLSLALTPVPLAKLLTSPRAAAFLASPRFAHAAKGAAAVGRVTGELTSASARLTAILAEETRRERAAQP